MPAFENIFSKDSISDNKNKNIKNIRNKIVKILFKFKNQNLPRYNYSNTKTIKESNFITNTTKVVFLKFW